MNMSPAEKVTAAPPSVARRVGWFGEISSQHPRERKTLPHPFYTALTEVEHNRLLLFAWRMARRVLLLPVRKEPEATRACFGPCYVDHGRAIVGGAICDAACTCDAARRPAPAADLERQDAAVVWQWWGIEPDTVVASLRVAPWLVLLVGNLHGGLGGQDRVGDSAPRPGHVENGQRGANHAWLLAPSVFARRQWLESGQDHETDREADHEDGQRRDKAHPSVGPQERDRGTEDGEWKVHRHAPNRKHVEDDLLREAE